MRAKKVEQNSFLGLPVIIVMRKWGRLDFENVHEITRGMVGTHFYNGHKRKV